ncbi:phage portal protein [Nonomuraea insulae]|uniref:Phage portal protein n=1 Tax=Nonomuraea insulae TaxID=1616787 RepID=A0ABW1DBQ1_9ACTN
MRSLIGGVASLLNRAPIPYAGRHRPGLPFMQFNDSEAQLQAMGSVGTLFAIVHRTSNATSQVNWRLWRQAASGKAEDRTEVTRHLALDVLNRPNPFMTRQEFIETFQQHLDLTGEGWWVVGRDLRATFPMELWPVRPDRMDPVPHPTDFLSGYVYCGPDGEQVPLKRDEVIQLRMPNPLDPYRGMGPVQSILTDLDSSKYSAEWNRNFFANSAEPGGIIEVDRRLGDEEFDELRIRWNEQHRGVANAHRVAILEQGKWVDRKFTQRDMQFAELRNSSREIIREAFGFPKGMLGTVDDVNRANMEAGEVMFTRWMVVPRLERIKAALNAEFLPLFGSTGQGVEFDYDDPIPMDHDMVNAERDSRAKSARQLVEAGYHPDDVAVAVGLPAMRYVGRPVPLPQGDTA